MSDREITADLTRRILAKFSPDRGWFAVAEATLGKRRADAIAVSLYRSQAWAIHGFEVKASRGDWLKELQNPKKADDLHGFVDAWWVVTPKGLIKKNELPQGWGHLEQSGRGLSIKTRPKLPEVYEGIDRELFARFILKMVAAHREECDRLESKQAGKFYDRIDEEVEARIDQEQKRLTNEVESLRSTIAKFEETSGVKINQWNSGRIGEAVRIVLSIGRGSDRAWKINRLANEAADLAKSFGMLLDELGLKREPEA